VKSQELSDLVEKKECYGELSSSISSEEISVVGSKSARTVGSLVKSHFGVSCIEGVKRCVCGASYR
jgi:hypothetical protein